MKPRRVQIPSSDGLELIADVRGEPGAPGVLFLHGGGQTRHSWGGTAEALARAGRLAVTLDMRGHGESGWSPEGRYRVTDFARDMLEVIDGLFEAPPAVVGASLGGIAALVGLGESAPHPAACVILVDISTRIESAGAERIVTWMRSRPDGFASLDEVADAIEEYTRDRRRGRNLEGLAKNVRLGPDGRYRWHWDPALLESGDEGPSEIGDNERLIRAARALEIPALLVRGRQSDVISPEGAREFVDAAPRADFVDVSGAGHMVAGDRNDAFTRAVHEFLDRAMPVR